MPLNYVTPAPRLRNLLAATVIAAAAMMFCSSPASADPPPPGCVRDPIFGLNPQIRKICDGPINPDGSWQRARQFTHPEFVHSTCGNYAYHTHAGFFCPDWAPKDTVPAWQGPIDMYTVT